MYNELTVDESGSRMAIDIDRTNTEEEARTAPQNVELVAA